MPSDIAIACSLELLPTGILGSKPARQRGVCQPNCSRPLQLPQPCSVEHRLCRLCPVGLLQHPPHPCLWYCPSAGQRQPQQRHNSNCSACSRHCHREQSCFTHHHWPSSPPDHWSTFGRWCRNHCGVDSSVAKHRILQLPVCGSCVALVLTSVDELCMTICGFLSTWCSKSDW